MWTFEWASRVELAFASPIGHGESKKIDKIKWYELAVMNDAEWTRHEECNGRHVHRQLAQLDIVLTHNQLKYHIVMEVLVFSNKTTYFSDSSHSLVWSVAFWAFVPMLAVLAIGS